MVVLETSTPDISPELLEREPGLHGSGVVSNVYQGSDVAGDEAVQVGVDCTVLVPGSEQAGSIVVVAPTPYVVNLLLRQDGVQNSAAGCVLWEAEIRFSYKGLAPAAGIVQREAGKLLSVTSAGKLGRERGCGTELEVMGVHQQVLAGERGLVTVGEEAEATILVREEVVVIPPRGLAIQEEELLAVRATKAAPEVLK